MMTQMERRTVLLNTLPNVLLGVISLSDDDGIPYVIWEGQKEPVAALSQVRVTEQDIGRQCTLAFINADAQHPVIMGLLYTNGETAHPLLIHSDAAVILQSGKARIELQANGRIHLQGIHISSQAYGPNQLKGASVKIN